MNNRQPAYGLKPSHCQEIGIENPEEATFGIFVVVYMEQLLSFLPTAIIACATFNFNMLYKFYLSCLPAL